MNRSLVSIASLCVHGKDHLLAPRLKNADKLLLQEFDSLGAAKATYQPLRYYFGKIFHDVFDIWMHKHVSKIRPPSSANCFGTITAARFSVKHHNLKMGTQLKFLDISDRGNQSVSVGKLSLVSPLMYVIDQQKLKRVRSVVDTFKGRKAKFVRLCADWLRVPKKTKSIYQCMPETFESLAYNGTVRKLVYDLGCLPELLEWSFDWKYMVRAQGFGCLVLDKKRGNILKMDQHKYMKIAYHGFTEISREEKMATYGNTLLRDSYDEPDYTLIDTLFSLATAEAYWFAQLVTDFKDIRIPEKFLMAPMITRPGY